MPQCDMCGKETQLAKASIEGAEMNVCLECSKFGKIIEMPRRRSASAPSAPRLPPRRPEILQVIVPDYAQKVREAREKLGLTQEEFAKKLSEKQSIMQKIEAGQFRPSIKTARKLERLLKIRIVDQVEDGNIPLTAAKAEKSDSMTLGDFIKFKKR